MTDREALTAALGRARNSHLDTGWLDVIKAAARERLAQLPEKCEHGQTREHLLNRDPKRISCPGRVYPAELVESGMAALVRIGVDANDATLYRYVVAVLDALNGETA